MSFRSNFKMSCSVIGCLSTSSSEPDLTYFRLPTNKARLSEWLRVIGREDLTDNPNPTNYRVCEIHFNEQDKLPSTNRKILKRTCIPSLHLPNLDGVSRKEDKHTQTNHTYGLSKRKLNTEQLGCSKRVKVETETLENITFKSEESTFHKLCDKFLTKELALLVKSQVNSIKIQGTETRFSTDYIIFCLNFYFTNPQAYQFLRSALCMPDTTTLFKQSFPIITEINDTSLSIFKTKVKVMSEAEKNCSVMIGAMPLKEHLFYDVKADKIIGFHEIDGWQSSQPAQYALTIMVRGIFAEWQQPVAYALLSERRNDKTITDWVDKVLEILIEIGLNVRTFISDQSSVLWNIWNPKNRSISIKKPYFVINNKKIYYIFDVPHLIKNVRNKFMQYDFHFGNNVAKYTHVVQFFIQDSKKEDRLAPKLTDSHIKPTNVEKNKVRYATQLLSNSVAEGISANIDNNHIDKLGEGTAKFISIMNNLFDSLNSSCLEHSNEYKKAYAGNESQTKYFREMLNFFQDLMIINPNNGHNLSVKLTEGFQITITSLMLLFDELLAEGHTCLLTRRLNLDPLYTLVCQIREKTDSNMKPTSRQFLSGFKKKYFATIIEPYNRQGANYVEDLGKLLIQITDAEDVDTCEIPEAIEETYHMFHLMSNEEPDPLGSESFELRIKSDDYNQLDMPEDNSLFYLCGFILKRCSDEHDDCLVFKSYIKPSRSLNDESLYLRYQDYSKSTSQTILPIIPCDNFVVFVEEMDKIFRNCLKGKRIDCKISESIFELMNDIPFSPPCPCFPKDFVMKLFIRIRIFNTLKLNNKGFRSSQRNHFTITNL